MRLHRTVDSLLKQDHSFSAVLHARVGKPGTGIHKSA
jgi:hypothetical protein